MPQRSSPPGKGHNRAPIQLARHLEQGHPDVQDVLKEIERLRETARAEASSAVARYVRQFGHERRFIPSRLRDSPSARAHLADLFAREWRQAIAKRMPQLRRLQRKLSRICVEYHATPLADAALEHTPHYDPSQR